MQIQQYCYNNTVDFAIRFILIKFDIETSCETYKGYAEKRILFTFMKIISYCLGAKSTLPCTATVCRR